MSKIAPVLLRSNDLIEVFVDEQELCEIIEHFVVIPQRRVVPIVKEELIGDAVDRSHQKGGKVPGITQFLRGEGKAVPQLERRLLGERTEHDLGRFGQALKEQVHGSEDQHQGFAGSRPGDDQYRPFRVADGLFLCIVEGRECSQDRVCNSRHSSPSLRKLNTSSAETMR